MDRPIRATLGVPAVPTFPHKIWRTVYMRSKKMAQLEGKPFCDFLALHNYDLNISIFE